jgi:hypothetical protein
LCNNKAASGREPAARDALNRGEALVDTFLTFNELLRKIKSKIRGESKFIDNAGESVQDVATVKRMFADLKHDIKLSKQLNKNAVEPDGSMRK